MKTLTSLAIIAALATISIAQRAQNNTDEQLTARNAPDLFVYSASAFGPDKDGHSNFTVEVGNTGSKTITAIEWEYYSPGDAYLYDKRSSLKFRNDAIRVQPDQRVKLAHRLSRYTDKLITGFRLERMRILRVEYEDGSSWHRRVDQ